MLSIVASLSYAAVCSVQSDANALPACREASCAFVISDELHEQANDSSRRRRRRRSSRSSSSSSDWLTDWLIQTQQTYIHIG